VLLLDERLGHGSCHVGRHAMIIKAPGCPLCEGVRVEQGSGAVGDEAAQQDQDDPGSAQDGRRDGAERVDPPSFPRSGHVSPGHSKKQESTEDNRKSRYRNAHHNRALGIPGHKTCSVAHPPPSHESGWG
jgi:hypothetical protein